MKRRRITTLIIVTITLAVFILPLIRMPVVPQVFSLNAPGPDSGTFVEVTYLAVSGLLTGASPLFILASMFLGILLFVYNQSRVRHYTKYYLLGAFVLFYAFESQMIAPGGIEASFLTFRMIIIMAIVTILIAVLAQEISPGFAVQAAKNEYVKITYFIIIGALVALIILMYGGGASLSVLSYAAVTGSYKYSLLIYNLFAMIPSFILFFGLGNVRSGIATRFANDKEKILLVGTVLLFITMLVIEVISYVSGH